MYTEKRFEGEWWHPSDPDTRIGGIAEFTPEEGVSLTLFSTLNQSKILNPDENVIEHDFLLGTTSNGESVTLKDCICTNQTVNLGGASHSEYNAAALLSGSHYTESIEFNELRVDYPLLTRWAGISGLSMSRDMSEEEWETGDTVEVRYEQQPPMRANLMDSKIQLKQQVNMSMEWGGQATLEENTYLQFQPYSGTISYAECLEKAKQMQDFLTVATGEEIHPITITGITNQNNTKSNSQTDIMYKQSSGYEPPSDLNSDKDDSQQSESYEPPTTLRPFNANFLLTDIDGEFDEVMREWDEKYEQIKPLFDLYTSTIYTQMNTSDEMIALYRALNVYYRRRVRRHRLSEQTMGMYPLEGILAEIVDKNEKLFNSLRFEIESNKSDLDEAIRYYMTYDDNIGTRVDGERAITLLIYLRMVVSALLLTEMGIEKEQIAERLNRRNNAIE